MKFKYINKYTIREMQFEIMRCLFLVLQIDKNFKKDDIVLSWERLKKVASFILLME